MTELIVDYFKNLYKEDEYVYLKRDLDMNYVLGSIICDVNYLENSFLVYNKYWKEPLPDDIIFSKNLNDIDRKLRIKLLDRQKTQISKKRKHEIDEGGEEHFKKKFFNIQSFNLYNYIYVL